MTAKALCHTRAPPKVRGPRLSGWAAGSFWGVCRELFISSKPEHTLKYVRKRKVRLPGMRSFSLPGPPKNTTAPSKTRAEQGLELEGPLFAPAGAWALSPFSRFLDLEGVISFQTQLPRKLTSRTFLAGSNQAVSGCARWTLHARLTNLSGQLLGAHVAHAPTRTSFRAGSLSKK